MDYYEIYDPYYALIMAQDVREAVDKYIKVVAGEPDEEAEILENMYPVSAEGAIVKFARATGEDGELIPISELVAQLKSDQPEVLLIDGALI